MNAETVCTHTTTVCLNPHELIRKYRCTCGGVMMCACDEVFGRRFLAHQLSQGTELTTQTRVPVTLGFQPSICAECRGLPAERAPASEGHGRTSKIKRYYWRELFFEERKRQADWDELNSNISDEARREAHARIEADVLADIKAQHAAAPKYVFSETSQAEVLARYQVGVVRLDADYVDAPQKGAVIRDGDSAISPEAFVTRHYEAQGWTVMSLESLPLHALFGVMTWALFQDQADPRVRMVGFGDRQAFEAKVKPPPVIWTFLPDDFGTPGYGLRRNRAIARHFKLLPADREELLWAFDLWRSSSADFRQYLWAHREPDVERARRLIEILEPAQVLTILRYLIDDYWGRYLGWPDLLLHRGAEIRLVEVKSSGDRLSQSQKDWIADNHGRLKLPFEIAKIHRRAAQKPPKGLRSSPHID